MKYLTRQMLYDLRIGDVVLISIISEWQITKASQDDYYCDALEYPHSSSTHDRIENYYDNSEWKIIDIYQPKIEEFNKDIKELLK